eukprot:Platyproteum_vivax@DN12402_c0_g1_i1.p1
MALTYLSLNPNTKQDTNAFLVWGDPLIVDLPLRYKWVVWKQVAPPENSKGNYDSQTREFAQFATTQEFWRVWNHLPQPSELLDQKRMVLQDEEDGPQHVIDGLMIFRQGVTPKWEDELNACGGHFQFMLKRSLGGPQTDEYWNNLVLAIVGGTLSPSDKICGIRLVDKISYVKVEVWFTDYDSDDRHRLQKNIEKVMQTRLDG